MVNLSEIISKFMNAGIIGDEILDGTYMSPFIHFYKSGDIEAISKTILFETALIHSLGSPECKLRVSVQQLFDLKKNKAEGDMAQYMDSPQFKSLVSMGIFEANGDTGPGIDYAKGVLSETGFVFFTSGVELLKFAVLYQTGEVFTTPSSMLEPLPDLTDRSPTLKPEKSGIESVVKTLMEEFGNPSQPPLRFTRESAKISEEMDRKATHLLPRHARLC